MGGRVIKGRARTGPCVCHPLSGEGKGEGDDHGRVELVPFYWVMAVRGTLRGGLRLRLGDVDRGSGEWIVRWEDEVLRREGNGGGRTRRSRWGRWWN